MNTTIRPSTPDDAAGIAQVHVESWRTTYPGIMPEQVLQNLSVERSTARWDGMLRDMLPNYCSFVAEADGRIVGFCHAGPERIGDRAGAGEVFSVYLLADYQRQGIGKVLMRQAAQRLVELGYTRLLIWVAEDNPSRHFYEALGGVQDGQKADEFGGKMIREVSYYWADLAGLADSLQ